MGGAGTKHQLPPTCRDYNRSDGCSRSNCQELHLCDEFLRGRCTDKRCTKVHTLETAKNLKLLSKRGWSGPEDLTQALNLLQQLADGRAVCVCVPYNMGTCKAGDCGRLHVCHRYAQDKCSQNGCGLCHDLLDVCRPAGLHNVQLLESAGLGDTPVSELLAKLREQSRPGTVPTST